MQMLLASDGITIGEKWTSVLPSEIDVEFFTVHWEHQLRSTMHVKLNTHLPSV